MLFDLSIALRLRHDLSKVVAPTPRSGLVRHGYPWVPTDRLTAVPDKWVRPTRRPADLLMGPTDLIGSPHDLLKSFQKTLQMTLFRMTTRLGVQTSVDFNQADRRIWQVL
jgi:hypothetical protein